MKEVNNEKIMEEGGKSKKVLLSVIGILVVVLIALGCFMYFRGNTTSKNVYLRTIDEFASMATKTIDKANISKAQHADYNISFNLNSSKKEYKDIAKLVNNIKLNASLEADYKNKKAYMNYDVLYNNSSVVNANLYLNENDMYVSLPSLYDKLVKISMDDTFDLNEMWKMYNRDNYKTIINELTKIVKNNLKDEYFTSNDEKINVLGKEVNTTKQVLTLTSKDMVDLETNIINDMLKNDKLLKALSDTTNISVDDLKEELNTAKSEITEEETTFAAEIYINKVNQRVENVVIKYDEETLILDKTSDETFNIVLDNEKVGSLTIKAEEINLSVDYEETKLNYAFGKDTFTLSAEVDGMTITVKATGNEEKGNAELKVNVPLEKIDLTLNVDYEIKTIKNIQDKDFTNYVDLNSMTEEDMNSIMTKLYENEALLTLIQDVSNITGGLFTNQLY